MRTLVRQLLVVAMLFLLVGCTPFVNNDDDNEAPAPALNVGDQEAGEGNDDEGNESEESEGEAGGENEGEADD
jgi:hypothetical protein